MTSWRIPMPHAAPHTSTIDSMGRTMCHITLLMNSQVKAGWRWAS